MTVQELIDELKKFPRDAKVEIQYAEISDYSFEEEVYEVDVAAVVDSGLEFSPTVFIRC